MEEMGLSAPGHRRLLRVGSVPTVFVNRAVPPAAQNVQVQMASQDTREDHGATEAADSSAATSVSLSQCPSPCEDRIDDRHEGDGRAHSPCSPPADVFLTPRREFGCQATLHLGVTKKVQANLKVGTRTIGT